MPMLLIEPSCRSTSTPLVRPPDCESRLSDWLPTAVALPVRTAAEPSEELPAEPELALSSSAPTAVWLAVAVLLEELPVATLRPVSATPRPALLIPPVCELTTAPSLPCW